MDNVWPKDTPKRVYIWQSVQTFTHPERLWLIKFDTYLLKRLDTLTKVLEVSRSGDGGEESSKNVEKAGSKRDFSLLLQSDERKGKEQTRNSREKEELRRPMLTHRQVLTPSMRPLVWLPRVSHFLVYDGLNCYNLTEFVDHSFEYLLIIIIEILGLYFGAKDAVNVC